MCPIDPSPHGGEILHELPERKFVPEANGAASALDPQEPDIAHRPGLPQHPEQMAADIEDEEDDPVVDSGPGMSDGVRGRQRQRG
jgi:hypothetical protein